MDQIQYGIAIFQIIFLACMIYHWCTIEKFQKKFFNKEIINTKRDFAELLEDSTLEIFDKIDDLQYEVNDIHNKLVKFQQQQVSWVTAKKQLPDPLNMVLVLQDKTNTEHTGFLNSTKDSWTVYLLGGSGQRLSLNEVSYWKQLITK